MDPKEYRSEEAGRAVLTKTGYYAFIPNPLPPDIIWSSSLVSILSEAERDLSRLATLISAFPFPRLIIQPFMRNEAVLSSRIEGTHASLIDLYAYETAQLSFFERTNDVREVYNYVRAMDYGLDRLNTLPISLRLMRELHEKLMEDVRGGSLTPGEFRRSQNWIGPMGSTPSTAPYVPPPVEEMYQALDDLEKFIHSNMDIPLLIRAGMIHYQFEAIHPFLDGNVGLAVS
jgi:Fic family protein